MTADSENLTSVIFIGNPGVGKSTLHNALGGSFKHGFSPVVGMPVGEPQEVECNKRRLLLVDVPGICDHGQGVIDRNLSTLQSRLNNGNLYVVFFVIVPNRDGSISPRDLALMQLVLESVENGPQIGLIMTQIYKNCFNTVQSPGSASSRLQAIKDGLEFISADKHLALHLHGCKFSNEDCGQIQDYILSFKPKQVRIRKLLASRMNQLQKDMAYREMPMAQQQYQVQHQQYIYHQLIQQMERSSQDPASESVPQQTNQPRLRSHPAQISPSPSPPGLTSVAQKCDKCGLQLQGSFVRGLGATYHLDCFKCLDCGQIVTPKYFPFKETDGKEHPLCERDYFRRLNLVCHSCGEALRGSYITALDNRYHIEHFSCSVCPTVFGPQDSYYEHDGQVYCHYHYSLCHAFKCAGCRTAILKQFVETNRNSQDEHWHPECYMIHKFWDVKLSVTPPEEENLTRLEQNSNNNNNCASKDGGLTQEEISTRTSMEQRTPEELKATQQQMEEKIYQIWTVLSAFEESSAGCISEMMLHAFNGEYYDGVQMAGKFIRHVEILFAAIDDLNAQLREVEDQNHFAYTREAKMLCKKIVMFFAFLSRIQESGRKDGMTQESLSLITGLAHYLKILIRTSLTSTLELERVYDSKTVTSRFLNKLMELADKEKYLEDLRGKTALDIEVTADLCLSCRVTIEVECFAFDHNLRWHPKCLICSSCAKPLAAAKCDAQYDLNRRVVLCQRCKTPGARGGFSHVTTLEQYTFLLRLALTRLETLLCLKADDTEHESQGPHLSSHSTDNPLLVQGAIPKDSRSKLSHRRIPSKEKIKKFFFL